MSDRRERSGDTRAECPHGSACALCGEGEKIYWCETCDRAFAEKRCPQCGMKLKRVG